MIESRSLEVFLKRVVPLFSTFCSLLKMQAFPKSTVTSTSNHALCRLQINIEVRPEASNSKSGLWYIRSEMAKSMSMSMSNQQCKSLGPSKAHGISGGSKRYVPRPISSAMTESQIRKKHGLLSTYFASFPSGIASRTRTHTHIQTRERPFPSRIMESHRPPTDHHHQAENENYSLTHPPPTTHYPPPHHGKAPRGKVRSHLLYLWGCSSSIG